jgi:hypothetical protein
MSKTYKTIIMVLAVIIIAILGYWAYNSTLTSDTGMTQANNDSEKSIYEEVIVDELITFKECVDGGNPILESYPRQCTTSDGRTFIEEFCSKTDTQELLTLVDAKQIAANSECGNKFKEFSICNQDAGTWWIGLDIEKEGCSPVCVINVVTKEASIDWRCTDAID